MVPKVLQYLNQFMSLPLEVTTITVQVQACLGSSIIACQCASHRIICFSSAVHFKQWSYYRRPVFPSREGRMMKDGERKSEKWEMRISAEVGESCLWCVLAALYSWEGWQNKPLTMVMESVRDGSSWHVARFWSNPFYMLHTAETVALHLSALHTNSPHTFQLTLFRYSLLAESFHDKSTMCVHNIWSSALKTQTTAMKCFINVSIFVKNKWQMYCTKTFL